MSESFLFYDLETFGQDPRRTRIAQFAAVRTDADLQVIEEPASFFVRPADDLLPSPYATLVTGITPQHALREGVTEAEAFSRIIDQMARPKTCSLGYNSLRFDDEFVRFGLFRNFHDPYEREWRNGNSRWDLLDMLRLVHALRPDGITWPQREDGATSFKLEQLATANGVREGDAHEALSDVYATIGMARLFKLHQPRMWDYALRLRDKRFCASLLDVVAMQPVLHVSQRYPAARLCAAPVLPLSRHPRVDSRVIVFDLEGDIAPLLDLSPEEIAERLYLPASALPEGEQRIGLKEVHLNKAPALVAWSHLRAPDLQRLRIDAAAIEAKAARLRELGPQLAEKVRRVYAGERAPSLVDADASLYDGFLGDVDRRLLPAVRASTPEALSTLSERFTDPRLPELLFRYRARNWPLSLSPQEQLRWDDYRRRRLIDDNGLSELTFEQFWAQIGELRISCAEDPSRQVLLDQLSGWGADLQRSL